MPKTTITSTNIVLLAIILILVSTVVYLIIQPSIEQIASAPSAEPTMTSTPSATPSPATTPTTADTADWKAYRNANYGIEFKYPTNWYIRENDGEKYEPTNSIKIIETSRILCCKTSFDNGMDLKIFYSSDFSKYPVLQNLFTEEKNSYSPNDFTVERYNVQNFEGVRRKTASGKSTNVTYEEEIELYLKKDNGFYTIFWNSMDPNRKGFTSQAYLEKMLSTFKFIK